MRFNPPPNWPRPPQGWEPPPGWVPDPSWPQPPWGWALWVEDDEVLISPAHAVARPVGELPWYQRTLTVVLFLVFFFPVGLVLLWMRPDWPVGRRVGVTALVAVMVLIVASNHGPPPSATTTATTQLNPATGLGVGSPSASGASASVSASRSARAVSPGRVVQRAKSAPVRTSGPAVVGRPAPVTPATTAPVAVPPPVPTTQAPPPPPPPAPSTTTAAPPPPSSCGAPSNPYGYNFCGVGGYVTNPPSDICDYFSCISSFWRGHGYMIECNDGMYSLSGGISGACSFHGGEDRPVNGG